MLIVGVIFLIVGILLLFFKADWLIAGYNSLSEDEKQKKGYNMPRFLKMCGLGFIILSIVFIVISVVM